MDTVRSRLAIPLAAGVAAVAGSYAAVGFAPSLVVTPLTDLGLAVTPDWFLAWAIPVLGHWGKRLLVAGAVAGTVGLFAATVAVPEVVGRRRGWPFAGRLAAGVLAALALGVGLGGSFASGLGAAVGVALVVGVAGGEWDTATTDDRRRLLRATGAAVGVVGAGAVGRAILPGGGTDDSVERDPLAEGLLAVAERRSLDVDGLDPLVSEGFYEVDIATPNPRVDPAGWSLSVTGAVDRELEFDLAELTDREAEHRFVTLRCVSDAINGHEMDNALWTGAPVDAILEEAGAPEECCVMLRAEDGYFVEFPREALEPGLLAWKMNGAPLPRGHGSPVRALVPGHWGEVNAKWLTEIEVLEEPAKGYWEERGWHGTGPVNAVAKLHAVNTDGDGIELAGHAYAGTRGVSRVEVSTDGGDSWASATLSEPLPASVPADADPGSTPPDGKAADAWRMWRYTYDADGKHEVLVRMVDGEGNRQPRSRKEAFPSGATGWVKRTVEP